MDQQAVDHIELSTEQNKSRRGGIWVPGGPLLTEFNFRGHGQLL